jgi:hypothetical protein
VRIDAGVAELVVGRSLVLVREHFVRFFRFLEVLLGLRVVRIAVRVPLHGVLAVRLLDVLFGGVPVEPENFVVVALRHSSFR